MSLADQDVVVTGATGHVGANLVRQLLAEGFSVRATQHSRGPSSALPSSPRLTVVPMDVGDRASVDQAFRGAGCVFHLASKISIVGDPEGEVWRTNVEGARNVAEAALAAGVQRLVHCSSVHAFDFGSRKGSALDESCTLLGDDASIAAYDRSKAAGQREVLRVVEQGLNAVIVQPTGVIGPNDFGPSRMGKVFLDLKNKKLPGLTAGGFDFLDVRDLAATMIAALRKGRLGENYLLGGHYVTIVEIAEAAEAVTGVRAPRTVSPLWLARGTAPFFEVFSKMTKREPLYTRESIDTITRGCPTDCTKAKEELGHRVRPLAETVQDVYASFAERGL